MKLPLRRTLVLLNRDSSVVIRKMILKLATYVLPLVQLFKIPNDEVSDTTGHAICIEARNINIHFLHRNSSYFKMK